MFYRQGDEALTNGAANLGLKDVIKSLEWVKANIWGFGGDPDRVTIFGESAGAILISLLYLNPEQNLFRSAVSEICQVVRLPLTRLRSWNLVLNLPHPLALPRPLGSDPST